MIISKSAISNVNYSPYPITCISYSAELAMKALRNQNIQPIIGSGLAVDHSCNAWRKNRIRFLFNKFLIIFNVE